MFGLSRNPDLNRQIFYCILASMAAVLAEDIRPSFLFLGDVNGHHQEWLGSTIMELQPFTWQLSLVCNQLVVGPTHACGGTLDLMTDVHDLVRAVVDSSGSKFVC